MKFYQKELRLPAFPRGFHLVSGLILKDFQDIQQITTGFLHVFILHTSASLCINEDADPTVLEDFESHFNKMVPEDMPYYKHHQEGPDDMPAHLKAALLGSSVQIPIAQGKLKLGTWQGIYLCEHRNRGGSRGLVLTAFGV